jgi:hypothetical protein
MEDSMKKTTDIAEAKRRNTTAPESAPKGKDAMQPCEKAFHPETARLKDADEACDDGVR